MDRRCSIHKDIGIARTYSVIDLTVDDRKTVTPLDCSHTGDISNEVSISINLLFQYRPLFLSLKMTSLVALISLS